MQSKNQRFGQNNNVAKERAYVFALNIIKFIESTPENTTTQIINKQLLRSATSISANIVEAQASSSRNDFKNFLSHALKSANETKFWLCLLRDSKKSEIYKTNKLLDETNQLSNILGKSILTLKNK
ncbi:MAG TPA: four helix bundle protein [Patescibacteria group bacterium]|nr:four helix bundle protein [Patescibacteria group bacterium]